MMTNHPNITAAQVERGISIARREGDLRWDWADLALEVALPAEGPGGAGTGGTAALAELRERIASKSDVRLADLPPVKALRDYRDAAAAVPPGARDGVSVYAAIRLGRYEPDKARRLAVIDELRADHPKGRVTNDAVDVRFGRAPTRTNGRPAERAEKDLKRASVNDRARIANELLDDPEVARRARRAPNWNDKTNAGRERQLKDRKRQSKSKPQPDHYLELLRLNIDISKATRVLEGWDFNKFALDEESMWLVADIHDDLISLGEWHDRTMSSVQAWLMDKDVRDKIAKLRNTQGRTEEEAATALRLADRLERKLSNRLER